MSIADEREALIEVLATRAFGKHVEFYRTENQTPWKALIGDVDAVITAGYRKVEAAPSDSDLRERAYSAVWAGNDFFQDRGDYQTAVDNGVIWRNVERALDAIIPLSRTPQPVQVEVTDDPIPRYAQLDIWMALYGPERSEGYELFRDEHGFAETWAQLCAVVRACKVEITDEVVARVAKAAYIAQYQDKRWAELAWEDMGGSEPSVERSDLEIAVGAAPSAALGGDMKEEKNA